MSDECKYERRISQIEKDVAVNDVHVKSIADSVKQMQKWIMGFIISIGILFCGSIVKDHMFGGKAIAQPQQEVKSNGR